MTNKRALLLGELSFLPGEGIYYPLKMASFTLKRILLDVKSCLIIFGVPEKAEPHFGVFFDGLSLRWVRQAIFLSCAFTRSYAITRSTTVPTHVAMATRGNILAA